MGLSGPLIPSLYFFLVQTLRLADFQQFSAYLPTAQQPPHTPTISRCLAVWCCPRNKKHVVADVREEVDTGAIAVESPPDSVICISDGLLKAIDRLSPVDLETPIRNGAFDGTSLGLDCSDSVYVVQIWRPFSFRLCQFSSPSWPGGAGVHWSDSTCHGPSNISEMSRVSLPTFKELCDQRILDET